MRIPWGAVPQLHGSQHQVVSFKIHIPLSSSHYICGTDFQKSSVLMFLHGRRYREGGFCLLFPPPFILGCQKINNALSSHLFQHSITSQAAQNPQCWGWWDPSISDHSVCLFSVPFSFLHLAQQHRGGGSIPLEADAFHPLTLILQKDRGSSLPWK